MKTFKVLSGLFVASVLILSLSKTGECHCPLGICDPLISATVTNDTVTNVLTSETVSQDGTVYGNYPNVPVNAGGHVTFNTDVPNIDTVHISETFSTTSQQVLASCSEDMNPSNAVSSNPVSVVLVQSSGTYHCTVR